MRKTPHRFSEETINVQLATLLTSRGLDANAETIDRGLSPDVLIILEGLKLVLEGRNETQRSSLMRHCKKRVEDGVADISMAILYPEELKTAINMADLARAIENSRFDGEIFYVGRAGIASTPFRAASLDEIVQTINTVFRLRVQNEIVREQVANLQETIEQVVSHATRTNLFFNSDVLVKRLKEALGIEGHGDSEDTNSRD